MGTQKNKKKTTKKSHDFKGTGAGAGSGAGAGAGAGAGSTTTASKECIDDIRSLCRRDAERLEAVTRSLPDHVRMEMTSDVMKNPDMYPIMVSERDEVVMGVVERAALRVRRELFIANVSRDVQSLLFGGNPSSSSSTDHDDGDKKFKDIVSKAVGLATLMAEGMRGSFSFSSWFVETMIKTQNVSKEDLVALKCSDRIRVVAIGMYVFIRALHEVFGKERLFFPGNLVVTLRYVYGMFYSNSGVIKRNGDVYCAAACLLALGTFGSPHVYAALDEIHIPHHERCSYVATINVA